MTRCRDRRILRIDGIDLPATFYVCQRDFRAGVDMRVIPTLFSVSYAGYWGQHRLSVKEFLHKAAALGYAAVEIGGKRPHLAPLDYQDLALLDAIRAEAAQPASRDRHGRGLYGLHRRAVGAGSAAGRDPTRTRYAAGAHGRAIGGEDRPRFQRLFSPCG